MQIPVNSNGDRSIMFKYNGLKYNGGDYSLSLTYGKLAPTLPGMVPFGNGIRFSFKLFF